MRYADGKIFGKAIVFSKQEWDNLLGRINEGRQLQERNEDRIAREESKKEMSKKITADWPNTLAVSSFVFEVFVHFPLAEFAKKEGKAFIRCC